MPAPQATMMKPLARMKFMNYGITMPPNFKQPQGQAGDHYGRAFKDSEKNTAPAVPPLVKAASTNKYHTDAQKMICGTHGKYMDDMCQAICTAWGQWMMQATLV